MRRAVAAVAIVVAVAACYERGKGRPSPPPDDAAASETRSQPAAQSGDPAGAPDPAAQIAIRLEAEPAHLNPLLAGDAIARRVTMGDVYEGLLCRQRIGEPPRPCLAERVEVDAEATAYTFHLRRGVRWHDGEPFEAADVLFTFRLITGEAKAPSLLAGEIGELRSIEQIDEHTVRLVFGGFRVGREDAIAAVPILPRHVFGEVEPESLARAAASRAPIGTGPLRFASWKSGEGIALERFDGYWGQPARARRIEHRLIESRQRAIAAMRAGELQVAMQLPADEAIEAARDDGVRLFSYDSAGYLAAVWNLRKPALSDVRVRRALGMLLDRRGIVEQVFSGYAHVIDGPFPVRGPAVPVAASFAAERRRAARLLGEVGAVPEVVLLVPSESRTMARVADIWAADAAPLAKLTVEMAPFSEVLSRARAGRFDAALLAFTTGDDFDHFPRFHSSQIGGQNYGGVADDALDAALERVRATPDPERRRELEAAIAARVDELQPYCFIASDRRVGLTRANVGGIEVTLDGLAARSLWVAR